MTQARTPLQMVLDGVAAWPDRDVLTFVETRPDGGLSEEVRTYRDVLANGASLAGALAAVGMGRGDAFALIMPNHPEFVEAMLASEIAGTVFVPIDPRTWGEKLSFMLSFAECRGAIVAPEVVAQLRPRLGELPKLGWIWVLGDCEQDGIVQSLASVLGNGAQPPAIAPRTLSDAMQLLYTSGTTGDPKAISATYSRFASIGSMGRLIGFEPYDRPFTGLSLAHANAQLITLANGLAMGLRMVISRRFTKSRLWEILVRYDCTTFNLLGGMATAIFAEAPTLFDRQHRVRHVLSAGMPTAMWRAFEERFAVKIFEFFGTAEGGLTLNPPGAGPIGSIGKAAPGSICAILRDDGAECAPLERGEICFRNTDASVAPVTYLHNDAASRAKTRGGWFHSGDVGFKDPLGWLYFSHRAGKAIRRNGEFIDARAIEAVIAELPQVTDVYVYGLATADSAPGEKEVIAAVVPRLGPTFDPRDIFDHCALRLGPASTPSFVQAVAEIPKTASEKPQDRQLIAMFTDPLSQTVSRTGLNITSHIGRK